MPEEEEDNQDNSDSDSDRYDNDSVESEDSFESYGNKCGKYVIAPAKKTKKAFKQPNRITQCDNVRANSKSDMHKENSDGSVASVLNEYSWEVVKRKKT